SYGVSRYPLGVSTTNSLSPRPSFSRLSISLGITTPVAVPTAVSLRVAMLSSYTYRHNYTGVGAATLLQLLRLNADVLLAGGALVLASKRARPSARQCFPCGSTAVPAAASRLPRQLTRAPHGCRQNRSACDEGFH